MPDKIGFVGVGRMGANMALRLKECGCPIAAVFDLNAAAAQTLAQELACVAADQLQAVIALKLAKHQGLSLPLAAATRKQFDRLVRDGFGGLDKSGIAELTF